MTEQLIKLLNETLDRPYKNKDDLIAEVSEYNAEDWPSIDEVPERKDWDIPELR